MTIVLEIVFALIFFALIMASIALHEVGHLIRDHAERITALNSPSRQSLKSSSSSRH